VEGLEVDVRRVDVIVNVVKGLVSDVAIGDHHRFQAIFPGLFADVDNVFAPDGRLVVGERDGLATVFQGQKRHIFGGTAGNAPDPTVISKCPSSAEETAHVAARRAHTKDARARQKMIQRLLLDGSTCRAAGRRNPRL